MDDRYLATLDHEELLVRRGRRSGLFTMVAVHSTARGPALGGCRMWTYDDSRSAVRDVLRLSRAMTFKAAVAGLPLGGGKGVIMLSPGQALDADRRRAVLLDFADTVDALDGRYLTAEDVGTSDADMAVIAEGTRHVTGLAEGSGGSGDPSPWTALGVEAALRVACERVWGTPALEGRRVAVIGLGRVGGHLARLLAEWTDPDAALRADVDVVAPCALGGVLDDRTVPELRCKAIAGAANNQLASEGIADLISSRGILWAPDFVANAGGIVNIAVELEPAGYSRERAEPAVRAIGETMRQIFDDAAAIGATPLTAAMELARRRVAEASSSSAA